MTSSSQSHIIAKIMTYDTSYNKSYDMSAFNKYERTYEVCNENTVCMFSGNVIKLNTYSLKEPFIVNNHDSEFCQTLEKLRIEHAVVAEQDDSYGDDSAYDSDTNLSEDDTAARLLTDAEYSYADSPDTDSGDYGYAADESEMLPDDEY